MTRRILLLAATLLSGALLAQPIGSYYCGSLSEQWGQPSDVRGGGGTRLIQAGRHSYDGSQSAKLPTSLIRMPWPRTTGCAHVALSATVYFRSGSNALPLWRATVSSPSVVRISQTEPAATNAALSAWRPSDDHSVVPSPAFRQKNCPRLRSVKPNSRSPLTTGELMYMEKSLFSHTVSEVHSAPRLSTLTAITGLPMPEKIRVSRYTAGVTMFCVYTVL